MGRRFYSTLHGSSIRHFCLPLCRGSAKHDQSHRLAFFNMFPLPNTGAPGALTNNYTAALVRFRTLRLSTAALTNTSSDKDTLFGHITYNGETTINPNGFPNVYIAPCHGTAWLRLARPAPSRSSRSSLPMPVPTTKTNTFSAFLMSMFSAQA